MRFCGLYRDRPLQESPAAIRAYRVLRTIASRIGFDVVRGSFYSPVPHVDELRPGTFERISDLPGLRWDLDTQLAFVRERLSGPAGEFHPPATLLAGSRRYAVENPAYGLLDATVAYAMVRSLRPRRIVELGSGYSTLVTAEAARLNEADGNPLNLEVYDPFPNVVDAGLPGLAALHRLPAQEVPLSVFENLDDGDVLFVDTTHVVKLGSEVNYVVLEVLPRLGKGVVVHIHDIFLPFEYPRMWLEDLALYWNEQYLIQAFLAHNDSYEVLVALHALRRQRRQELADALPASVVEHEAGSLWIRRTR
jgi:hypothetical protein